MYVELGESIYNRELIFTGNNASNCIVIFANMISSLNDFKNPFFIGVRVPA
jgi:ATP:corrinoid adenosyltransferase